VIAIFRKEINLFLSSMIGYVAVAIFLLANGLVCWVFPESNILDGGYAVLDPLFEFAPWVFMFLIPAITMRSFAEEKSSGTIELLATKPVTDTQIILGKYFAALFLVIFAILPTLLYFFSISELASPRGNVDGGAIVGSYIGLTLLGGGFAAIGLFTSAVSGNQIVAFITGLFACFVLYLAFDSFGRIPAFVGSVDRWLSALSMNAHYRSVSRGAIDLRDVVYFLSVVLLFLAATRTALGSRKW
jgi:ABC-2 type transport system permease protein